MALLGLDPMRYLYCRDPMERAMLVELHNRVHELHKVDQENLATQIANKVSKMFAK